MRHVWVIVLLLPWPIAACPGDDGPSEAAKKAYVNQKTGHEVGPDASAPVAPVARRLRLTVVSGSKLYDADDGPGVIDPYVVIDHDGEKYKTSVVHGSQDPTWGDTFVMTVRKGDIISVTLMDRDGMLSSDEKLGVQAVTLPSLRVGETQEIDVAYRGGEYGTVKLKLVGLDD